MFQLSAGGPGVASGPAGALGRPSLPHAALLHRQGSACTASASSSTWSAGRLTPSLQQPQQWCSAPHEQRPAALTPAQQRPLAGDEERPAMGRAARRRRSRTACRASSSVEQKEQVSRAPQDSGSAASPSANGRATQPVITPASSSSSAAALDDAVAYDGIIAEVPTKPSSLYVRVRNMVKHFQTSKGVFKAVDGVDVNVEPSSIVALLGPSGSGKTTLLRLVAGLESPTDGKILFDDFDATNVPVQDRQIGMVFQNYALFNHKTVAENISFGLEVRKLKIDHAQRVKDLLELVQLDGLGNRYPRQLSGGQRQRVALARALASNPRLLLLDEPFGALDAVVRKSLRAGLKEIVRSVGVTTIIVTHDQEEAFDLADKVVIFNRGRVEQQGTPNEIIKTPRTPFIMKFVGETNMVPATAQVLRKVGFSTTKSQAMFRPSDMQVSKQVSDQAAPAQVAERHNLGWTIKYNLRFDDGVEVEYLVSRDQDEKSFNLEVGQRVYVSLRPEVVMGFEPAEIDSAPIL